MKLDQIKAKNHEELVRFVVELLEELSKLRAELARLKKVAPSRK